MVGSASIGKRLGDLPGAQLGGPFVNIFGTALLGTPFSKLSFGKLKGTGVTLGRVFNTQRGLVTTYMRSPRIKNFSGCV